MPSSIEIKMFQHKANEKAFLTTSQSEDCRLKLPGYGRPLDYYPIEKNIYGVESRSMFPSALDDRDIENGYTEFVDTPQDQIMLGLTKIFQPASPDSSRDCNGESYGKSDRYPRVVEEGKNRASFT